MTTADSILDLVGGARRADRFSFQLLDSAYQPIGDLNVGVAPQIQMDTSRTVFWSMSGFSLYGLNVGDVDPFSDRVKATLTLQDGTPFPLGIFVFGSLPIQRKKHGDVWVPSMFDDSFFMDQDLDSPVSIAQGGSILEAFAALALRYRILAIDISRAVDQLATEPIVFVPGTRGLAALRAMAAILGCFPPYLNASGTLVVKPPPFPGDTTVDHFYDVGTHIVSGQSVLTSDLYQLPNRWILYATSQNSSIVGIYDLPDASPASALNRGGRIVSKTVQQSGLPAPVLGQSLQDSANLAARTAALQDNTVYEKATWQTTADPRHDVFDTVSLYGVRYLETGWTIDCKSGGVMSHSAIRLYD